MLKQSRAKQLIKIVNKLQWERLFYLTDTRPRCAKTTRRVNDVPGDRSATTLTASPSLKSLPRYRDRLNWPPSENLRATITVSRMDLIRVKKSKSLNHKKLRTSWQRKLNFNVRHKFPIKKVWQLRKTLLIFLVNVLRTTPLMKYRTSQRKNKIASRQHPDPLHVRRALMSPNPRPKTSFLSSWWAASPTQFVEAP